MSARWGRWFLRMLLAGAGACSGASADRGLEARLRVAGGQYHPGAAPAVRGGPAVTGLQLARTVIRPGEVDFVVSGVTAAGTTGVALWLEGDAGYWGMAAGVPDVTAPDQPTFVAQLSFAPTIAPGTYGLGVQAVDDRGHAGEPRRQMLTVAGTALPEGALVIGLRWDTQADLDLHVIEPDGNEIWARNPIGSASDGGVPGSDAGAAPPGSLDADSNAQCLLDGRRAEQVIYPMQAPGGTYQVRVDPWSLCGESSVQWTLDVRQRSGTASEPVLVAHATGQFVPVSTRGPHGPGAGLLALTFSLP